MADILITLLGRILLRASREMNRSASAKTSATFTQNGEHSRRASDAVHINRSQESSHIGVAICDDILIIARRPLVVEMVGWQIRQFHRTRDHIFVGNRL